MTASRQDAEFRGAIEVCPPCSNQRSDPREPRTSVRPPAGPPFRGGDGCARAERARHGRRGRERQDPIGVKAEFRHSAQHGVVVAAGILLEFFAGHLELDVHGFGIVAFAQSAWMIWLGAVLCRDRGIDPAR
jgi:hypothetical protein